MPSSADAVTTSGGSDAATRLAAGRLWAVIRMPYFATALFALRPVQAPGLGTFAVDPAWRLFVDPATVQRLPVHQIGSLLLHEVMHLLRDHAGRGESLGVTDRTAEAWNTACDAEINDDLIEAEVPLPDDPVLPSSLSRPDGLLAEDYYRPRRRGGRTECGSGAHSRPRASVRAGRPRGRRGSPPGRHRPAGGGRHRREAAAAVLHAARRSPGRVPGGLRRWATLELTPTVDWRRELAAALRRAVSEAAGKVDYRPGRRNRRAAALPSVVLPGLVQPLPSVAVVIDTSASVHADDLSAAVAEVDGIISAAGARRRVTVLAVDTHVRAVTRASRGRAIELAGGGGTDMARGIEAAAGLRPRRRSSSCSPTAGARGRTGPRPGSGWWSA